MKDRTAMDDHVPLDYERAMIPLAPALPTLAGLQRPPAQIVANAREVAKVLTEVIEAQKLYTELSYFSQKENKMITRKHVRLEGWTTAGILCGSLLGDAVVPHTVSTGPVIEDGKVVGYEALVEARSASGLTLATAKGLCLRQEKRWKTADDFAISSMAQTRAASRALRLALGWIVTMSGFDTTPAEEMDGAVGNGGPQKAQPRQSQPRTVATDHRALQPEAPPADTPWATKLRELQQAKGLSIPQILDLLEVSDVGADNPADAMRNHLAALRLRHDWDSEQAFKNVHDAIIEALKKEPIDATSESAPDEWEQTVMEGELATQGAAATAPDDNPTGAGGAAPPKPKAPARK